MENEKGYIGIDKFRIIAAILVVAIHTSPLTLWGDFPDYLLTRVIARLAVPFFFAATGFFLLAPYGKNKHENPAAILRFVKKTLILYGLAILIYLPVNHYAGHFKDASLIEILKRLFIEGTFYHLWYLPAAIAGVGVVWLMLRFGSLKIAMGISLLLYAVGLVGDNYYGLTEGIPMLETMYRHIFSVSEYTRNGLFLAPVFLVIGTYARVHGPIPRKVALLLLSIVTALLVVEGILLYQNPLRRHDSMYIMLPPCIYFLLQWLSTFTGPSNKKMRSMTLVVYIIHPLVIIAIRGAAKAVNLVPLIVENSLVHFVAVSVFSFIGAYVFLWLKGGIGNALRKRKAASLA